MYEGLLDYKMNEVWSIKYGHLSGKMDHRRKYSLPGNPNKN